MSITSVAAFGWFWVLFGILSGAILGLFFTDPDFLGGYSSFKRRMYRLGHIAFIGMGFINILYAITVTTFRLQNPSGIFFVSGGILMPIFCFFVGHFPKFKLIFCIPVFILGAGVSILTSYLLSI